MYLSITFHDRTDEWSFRHDGGWLPLPAKGDEIHLRTSNEPGGYDPYEVRDISYTWDGDECAMLVDVRPRKESS